MSTAELQWIESNGGPLLMLPRALLECWDGTDPPEPHRSVRATFRWSGGGPATDYDRACDVSEWLGVLPVGTGEGLVLGGEPLSTAWCPTTQGEASLLVRWEYAESDLAAARWLAAVPTKLPWRWSTRFAFDAEPLVLFDAAEPGLDPSGPRLELALPSGKYDIHTVQWQPDSVTSLMLHRFSWREVSNRGDR